MAIAQVIYKFTKGEATTLDISDTLGKDYTLINKLLTEAGVASLGECVPHTEPWEVLAALMFVRKPPSPCNCDELKGRVNYLQNKLNEHLDKTDKKGLREINV